MIGLASAIVAAVSAVVGATVAVRWLWRTPTTPVACNACGRPVAVATGFACPACGADARAVGWAAGPSNRLRRFGRVVAVMAAAVVAAVTSELAAQAFRGWRPQEPAGYVESASRTYPAVLESMPAVRGLLSIEVHESAWLATRDGSRVGTIELTAYLADGSAATMEVCLPSLTWSSAEVPPAGPAEQPLRPAVLARWLSTAGVRAGPDALEALSNEPFDDLLSLLKLDLPTRPDGRADVHLYGQGSGPYREALVAASDDWAWSSPLWAATAAWIVGLAVVVRPRRAE